MQKKITSGIEIAFSQPIRHSPLMVFITLQSMNKEKVTNHSLEQPSLRSRHDDDDDDGDSMNLTFIKQAHQNLHWQ